MNMLNMRTSILPALLLALLLLPGTAAPLLAQSAKASTTVKAGVWLTGCDAKKKSVCSARYVLADKNKKTALIWTIRYNEKKTLVSTVDLPHGVLLPKGVTVAWPNGESLKVDYRVCTREAGCMANVPVPKDIQAIAKARKGSVSFTVYSPSGKGIVLPVSVNGLDKALAKLKG